MYSTFCLKRSGCRPQICEEFIAELLDGSGLIWIGVEGAEVDEERGNALAEVLLHVWTEQVAERRACNRTGKIYSQDKIRNCALRIR